MNRFAPLLLLPLLSIILSSCTDEIDVQVDRPLDRPVIYCLLNPNDSVQYLRIQRIFLGNGSALETARVTDSIYFSQASVVLEEILGETTIRQIQLSPDYSRMKQDGIFATEGHYVYACHEQVQTGMTYRLTVDLPDQEKPIIAETIPYNNLEIIGVNRWPNGINMVNAKFARVSWYSLPETETYQLMIRFHYYEVTASDTTAHFVDWTIPRTTSYSLEGGEIMDVSLPINDWFLILADHIPVSEDIIKRVAGRFDYTWHFAGEPLESYITQDQTTRNGLLSDYPQYSNIENAIGVFSYRSNYEVKGYSISLYTLERLTTHPATKWLKFDGRQYW